MRPEHVFVCSIVPPHILRSIAERGDDEQRAAAHVALEISSRMRGVREAVSLAAMVNVPAGQKRRTVYDARGLRKLPGKPVRGEGDRRIRDLAADEAYDGCGKTHDFFASVMDRNSVDDRGLRLDSTVHYGAHYCNALWNGRQMIYGDGDGRLFHRFTRSLEVIGHELAHGVIQHSAILGYADQGGALNEHFADVFGVLVKQYAKRQTAAKADWLVGAGLFTRRVKGRAIRSMKAPGTAYDDPIIGKDPQPDHMRDYVRTSFDNGGVHVNSGIPNRAFYEAAIALGGRAWEIAGRIWYRALTRKLRDDATFRDCAAATCQVAREMYGERSEPAEAVRAAWRAVGIEAREVAPLKEPRLAIRMDHDYWPPVAAAELPQVAAFLEPVKPGA